MLRGINLGWQGIGLQAEMDKDSIHLLAAVAGEVLVSQRQNVIIRDLGQNLVGALLECQPFSCCISGGNSLPLP